MSEYPRDRYDDVPEYTEEHGAHRATFAAPKGRAGLNWIIISAAIALGLGVISFILLPQLRNTWFSPDSDTPQTAQSESATAQPTESADPEDTAEPADPSAPAPDSDQPGLDENDETGLPDDAEDDPFATGEDDQGFPQDPDNLDSEASDSVNYTQAIEVYNASEVAGLAAQATEELVEAGFNVPVTANWAGNPVAVTTVFYADDQATAEAVAAQLGITATYTPNITGIAVVLTADYAG